MSLSGLDDVDDFDDLPPLESIGLTSPFTWNNPTTLCGSFYSSCDRTALTYAEWYTKLKFGETHTFYLIDDWTCVSDGEEKYASDLSKRIELTTGIRYDLSGIHFANVTNETNYLASLYFRMLVTGKMNLITQLCFELAKDECYYQDVALNWMNLNYNPEEMKIQLYYDCDLTGNRGGKTIFLAKSEYDAHYYSGESGLDFESITIPGYFECVKPSIETELSVESIFHTTLNFIIRDHGLPILHFFALVCRPDLIWIFEQMFPTLFESKDVCGLDLVQFGTFLLKNTNSPSNMAQTMRDLNNLEVFRRNHFHTNNFRNYIRKTSDVNFMFIIG